MWAVYLQYLIFISIVRAWNLGPEGDDTNVGLQIVVGVSLGITHLHHNEDHDDFDHDDNDDNEDDLSPIKACLCDSMPSGHQPVSDSSQCQLVAGGGVAVWGQFVQ